MLVTYHWSATSPNRINDYHVEFGAQRGVPGDVNAMCKAALNPGMVNWEHLKSFFTIWKNVNFDIATSYGTWHLNHDPRDESPNIEVGALCMGGESVSVTGPWGNWPHTYAHAWMGAAIIARICKLKGIDPEQGFSPDGFQNLPMFPVSTHAERAIQTPDEPAANLRPSFGYFIYSGDPDSRWDMACRDVQDAKKLATPDNAKIEAIANAAWMRKQVKAIMQTGITDFWGLDKPAA